MANASSAVRITFIGSTKGLHRSLSELDNALGRHDTKMGKLGAGAAVAGKALATGLAAGAVAAAAGVQQAISKAMSFDKTMRLVGASTQASSADMKQLSKLALDMGAKTVFSADDAAQAMLELAKGGMNAAKIKGGALKETLTLAAAGGVSLAEAATTMSNQLNTFGIKAKNAGQVSAALAGGANASSASVESLSQALSQVGPGAKLAGLSIQETVGALAAFDNAGVKGSDAGTSLKTMLMRLVPQTDKAAGAMKDLGLKFTDAHGNILPMANIAEQLKTKLHGLNDEQKTTALTTMFGSDAYRAAAIMADLGAKGVNKYTSATSDADAANRMAKASMQGASGAWENFKGSVETLAIQIGLKLLPAFTRITNWISNNVIPAAMELADWLGPRIGPVIARVSEWVDGKLVPALKLLWQYVTQYVVPAFKSVLGPAIEGAKSAFKSISEAIEKNREPLQNIGDKLMKLAGFIRDYVAPVVGVLLKAAFKLLGEQLGTTITWVARVGSIVADFASGVMSVLGPMIRWLTNAFLTVFGAILHGAAKAFGWVPGVGGKLKRASKAFDEFRQDVKAALDGVAGDAYTIGANVSKGMANGIRATTGLAVGAAGDMANKVAAQAQYVLDEHSPSKVFAKIGAFVGKGFVKGLVGSTDEVTATMDKLMQLATGKAKAAVTKAVGNMDVQLKRMAAKRDALLDAFSNVRSDARSFGSVMGVGPNSDRLSAAEGAKSDADSALSSALSDRVTAYDDLARAQDDVSDKEQALARVMADETPGQYALVDAQDALNQAKAAYVAQQAAVQAAESAVTAATAAATAATQAYEVAEREESMTGAVVVAKLGEKVAAMQTFQENIAELKRRGLNPQTLSDIIAAGVESGSAMAQALVDSSNATLGQLNVLQGQVNSASTAIASTAAPVMYTSGQQVAQGLINGFDSMSEKLQDAMHRMAKRMRKAIRKALGINSPSKVFAEVGEYVGAGLAVGIENSQSDVTDATTSLVQVPAMAGGGGSSMHIEINMPPGSDGADVVRAIQAYERRNGSGWRA